MGSPTDRDERLARATLSIIGEPGDVKLATWLHHVGPVRALADIRDGQAPELSANLAGRLPDADAVATLERAASLGVRFVAPGDEEWPTGLDDLAHGPQMYARGGPPIGLWVRGPQRLNELVAGAVSVVGSRMSTTYGEALASEFAAGIAGTGRCVVSGGAFGIDLAAHRGALAVGGPTLAVLPCGLDRSYPLAHASLFERLARDWLLVSETPPGGVATKVRFLSRNRIIAALGEGTVVVEAAARSGALSTANWAAGIGRPLMGVPGPVTSAVSEGVHEMVRFRNATLVTRSEEILEVVSESGQCALDFRRATEDERDRLSLEARQVLDAVPVQRPSGTASIARVAGLSVSLVAEHLADLHNAGFVVSRDGGWHLDPG
jgi:DNA processing protein